MNCIFHQVDEMGIIWIFSLDFGQKILVLSNHFISCINVRLQIVEVEFSNESAFLLKYFRNSLEEKISELREQMSLLDLVEAAEGHTVV